MLDPGAVGLDVLAGHGAGQMSDDRDQVAPALDLHAQHRISAFRVVCYHALNNSGQCFRHDFGL